ncbi:hypothetical protein V7S79_04245 [Aquirufa sp. ROCK-SH2]
MMVFEELAEFQKDVKALQKKYRSIPEDLAVIKRVLEVSPDERPPFSFRISDLGLETCVIKVKKIACKSLKGKGVNSGLRLIYAQFVGLNKIVFVELYHKSNKEMEDKERILRNFI